MAQWMYFTFLVWTNDPLFIFRSAYLWISFAAILCFAAVTVDDPAAFILLNFIAICFMALL